MPLKSSASVPIATARTHSSTATTNKRQFQAVGADSPKECKARCTSQAGRHQRKSVRGRHQPYTRPISRLVLKVAMTLRLRRQGSHNLARFKCSKYFDVDNSQRDLSHSKADKCMLKRHPYDPKGHWLVSHASVLGSNWTKDDNVEFKLQSGHSYYVEIPVARYPTAKVGDKFRLVVGASLMCSRRSTFCALRCGKRIRCREPH